MFSLSLLLLTAAAVAIDPAFCRQVSSGNTGAAAWQRDGQGNLSISMDAHSTGEVSLRCRVKLPNLIDAATLEFDHVLISFQPAGTKREGSGLTLFAGDCRGMLLRVAGEDWIEAPHRAWTTTVAPGSKYVEVTVRLVDNSDRDPVRVDLRGLRVIPGRAGNADVCEPRSGGKFPYN
ncbi:MAG: hypothetical protein H7Y20_11850 [Bryobacteraceae bacterium]|nr:hypothetical protein [Bryobacteraceae bacterium]